MELITDSKILEEHFLRLLDKYSKYYWMTAWAGTKSLSFEKLKKNKHKIENIIVGIHFYQTHPDFIESFLNTSNVKYIKQPDGTFHPKIFLFYNNPNEWELLVGSANFTNAAFSINTEISTLIKSTDLNAAFILQQTFQIIDSYWTESKQFDKKGLDDYRKIWKKNRPIMKILSDSYEKQGAKQTTKNKPIYFDPIAKIDWQDFMDKVYSEKHHPLLNRINVLQIAKKLFEKVNRFSDLNDDERKFIAGVPNKFNNKCGYFGSMKRATKFTNKIINNDQNISKALDEIPLSGQITKAHYQRFLDHFKATFVGNCLATATRLLTMKRPDVFVCLNSKNKSDLCKGFGIKQNGLNYERYWNDIIELIYKSQWWLNPNPKEEDEKKVSNSRAAFLDSLYYKEK